MGFVRGEDVGDNFAEIGVVGSGRPTMVTGTLVTGT